VDEFNADNPSHFKLIVGDKIERNKLKGVMPQSGYYSCEICKAKGHKSVPRGALQWPPGISTRKPLRTDAEMRDFARITQRPDADDRFGYINECPLVHLNADIDLVWCFPLDVFHLCFEGITAKMLKNLFLIRTGKLFRDLLADFTKSYEAMKVFSETARYTRRLNLKRLKGHEYGVITLSALPHLFGDLMRVQQGTRVPDFW